MENPFLSDNPKAAEKSSKPPENLKAAEKKLKDPWKNIRFDEPSKNPNF